MNILGLSGSLRAASLNTLLLHAVARLAPAGISIAVYDGMGDLPLFNPDLEASDPPPVAKLRNSIIAADALIIASPEYAHGVTGTIKNALDWMVGNESFVNKPVALLNASPRASHALAALRETLLTMSANVIDEAYVAVPLLGSGLSENDLVAHPTISPALARSLTQVRAIVANQK